MGGMPGRSIGRLRPGRCFAALLGGLVLLAGAGCRSDDTAPPEKRRVTRMLVLGIGRDHATWPVLQAVSKVIERRNGRLELTVDAPASPSPSEQIKLLEQLGAQVDLVCVQPSDPAALAPAIDAIARGGVPVVTFGCDSPNTGRSVYCGPVESDIGQKAAEAAGLLPRTRSTSILLLHGGVEYGVLRDRYQAMRLNMSRSNGMMLLREISCGANRIEALDVVRAETRKYPRSAGWVLLEDWPLRALGANERLVPEGYGVVLCSNDPIYLDHIEDGRITALVGFDYREAVQQGLFAALRMFDTRQRIFSPLISVEPEIITRENLAFWRARWRAWQTGAPPPTTQADAAPAGRG